MPFTCKTLDDFLEEYGEELGKEADRAMQPLHIPSRDGIDHLVQMGMTLYPGQQHVVAASVKVLHRQDYVNVVAEQGSGKTAIAVAVAHNHACGFTPQRWHAKNPEAAAIAKGKVGRFFPDYRALVMCPGHLPRKWAREVARMMPDAKIRIIESYKEVVALDPNEPPEGPEWFIVGKDRAKLSSGWRGAYNLVRLPDGTKRKRPACPRCSKHQKDERLQVMREQEWFEVSRRKCEHCGEQMWQDVAEPRRYSPALFIKKKLPGYFDYYVMDEVQDGRSPDSIQAEAMGFLASACKKTITLTGTIVGGKATDVRTTLFRVGAAESLVNMGLQWEDETAFVEKYGRIETKIVGKYDADGEGHRMARGQKSSRKVTKTIKPGIMPTLFGEHLVSACVFLTLDEVCADLPPFYEEVVPIQMDPDHKEEYDRIEGKLREHIRLLMRKGGVRKLLSKMLHALLGYPDHPFDWKEIGYHFADEGTNNEPIWIPVVTPADMSKARVFPKEKDLIDRVKREKSAGRKCWVFTTLVGERDSIGRIEASLNASGITAKVLRADDVPPIKREEWIEKHGPRYDVILSHPELVKTGLDFFDQAGRYNFPTIVFYMTGYDGFTLSQASRRAWRIGQKEPCKVVYMFYAGTMQETAMTLMGRKMAACSAVSGRFSMEGLAAMAGDDDGLEMAMARALVEKTATEGEAIREWARIVTAPPAIVPTKKHYPAFTDEDLPFFFESEYS